MIKELQESGSVMGVLGGGGSVGGIFQKLMTLKLTDEE